MASTSVFSCSWGIDDSGTLLSAIERHMRSLTRYL